MLRGCIITALAILFVAATVGVSQAQTKRKGSYAGCVANLQKKGYSAKAASHWCTANGYNN